MERVKCLLTLFVALFAGQAFAQGFHLGLKVGVPLTDYFETSGESGLRGAEIYSAATRRYTAGASVEWRFTRSLGVEVDTLYKRMGYVGLLSGGPGTSGLIETSSFDVKGNSWDIPLMAKYRFGRLVRPYVAGGLMLRYVGPLRARGQMTTQNLAVAPRTTTTVPIDTSNPSEFNRRVYPGLSFAGGVEFGRGRLRFLPELRYTHWTANLDTLHLRFAPDQVEMLLGLLF